MATTTSYGDPHMYIPNSFRENNTTALFEFIQAHPLGLIISMGLNGLSASPIPWQLYPNEGASGVLRGHMARANPHWKDWAEANECLLVFQGPQSYICPSWYASKSGTHKVVPTWNYAMVQVWGSAKMIEDTAWLRGQLDDLTRHQEQLRPVPWSLTDAPEDFLATQRQAIVGIEIAITRLAGKFKMSQNRPEADRAGVIAGLSAPADPHHNPSVAEWVEKANKPN